MSDIHLNRRNVMKLLQHASAPLTVREVQSLLHVGSSSTAHSLLKALEDAGLVRQVSGYELTSSGKAAIKDGSEERTNVNQPRKGVR